jgi:hypothetical protein
MDAKSLIKKRINELKEKELTEGLTHDERVEIGKLYITDQNNDHYEEIAYLQNQEYWKTRCLLFERFISTVTIEMNDKKESAIKAKEEYDSFLKTNKEPEK